MSKTIGKVNLILHAHSPYVRHLEYDKFLEEDWLFESLNETYIPLLRMLEKLDDENIDYHLSISFSPTLCTMLTDAPLQERFLMYMQERLELGQKEEERCLREAPEFAEMAKYYRRTVEKNLETYEKYERNILTGFKQLASKGHLELVATAASNSYLPLYKNHRKAVVAQVKLGIKEHLRFFGQMPKGFWLPECGYYSGLEEVLEENNIKWTLLASHCVLSAKNRIESAGYQPIKLGNSRTTGFVRDWSLTNLIWSSSNGYPCDPDYREFYRDIGYDLPLDYVRPYIHDDVRVFTGFKYWAITGKTDQKKPYSIDVAREKVKLHAENFLYHIRRKGILISSETSNAPVINLGFDAELFGHRWFEGIYFLEYVLRGVIEDNGLEFTTPSKCLENMVVEPEKAFLNDSSWGSGGYSDVWLDGSNAWIYRHTHRAIEALEELAMRFPDQTSLKGRFLNQAAREVILAMASDWPYIMHDKTSVKYAEKRLRNHLGSFRVAYTNMCKNAVNTEWLIKAEKRNAIFPDMDYNIFNTER